MKGESFFFGTRLIGALCSSAVAIHRRPRAAIGWVMGAIHFSAGHNRPALVEFC
jgi:hypothetical protein